MNIEETCLSFLDTDYSYEIAKRMETHKTNPALGYRTAGSRAERATGDILFEEMQNNQSVPIFPAKFRRQEVLSF